METPLDLYVKWYEPLPEKVRGGLAWQALALMPGIEPWQISGRTYDEATSNMINVLRGCEPSISAITGLSIALRALTEFVFAKHAPENFEKLRELSLKMRSQEPPVETVTSQVLASLDQDKQDWIKSYESWTDLRDGPLSDSNIEKWQLIEIER